MTVYSEDAPKVSMKTSVVNMQRSIPVNVPLLKKNIIRIKRVLGIQKFKLDVQLRSDKTVKEMNKWDRNVDKTTDVLSYSAQVC